MDGHELKARGAMQRSMQCACCVKRIDIDLAIQRDSSPEVREGVGLQSFIRGIGCKSMQQALV